MDGAEDERTQVGELLGDGLDPVHLTQQRIGATLGKTHLQEVATADGDTLHDAGVEHGVVARLLVLAGDADIMAIEVETVLDGHIGQIVHTDHAAYGQVLPEQHAVEHLHGFLLAEEAVALGLTAQKLGDALEEHSREGAERGDRHARHLDEGHVCKKKSTCQAEDHRF